MTQTAPATDLRSVARRLALLCKEQRNLDAINELYHDDIVSVEAMESPDCETGREARGIDAIRAKNEWWTANHEVHDHQTSGPYPHGDDRFAMHFTYDITPSDGPAKGQRFTMTEVGVYTVDHGKIVREEFFYDCPMGDQA